MRTTVALILYGALICSTYSVSSLRVGTIWSGRLRPEMKGRASGNGGWGVVDAALLKAMQNETFPGCVAAVGNKDGFMYLRSFGNFTYGDPAPISDSNPPMTNGTYFDLASLTKVLATTTATMILYQKGQLDLDMKVSDSQLLGPDFANNGKGSIAVRNLLLHNAGFPPDPNPNYYYPVFGCPQTANYHPAEDFSCQDKIYCSLLNQTLQYPVGTKYIYSDLSMITMMHVVGARVRDLGYVKESDLNLQCVHGHPEKAKSVTYYTQCYYEAFVRQYILQYLSLSNTGFLPAGSLWKECAPTWNDSTYRHEIMQGVVSDGNSYALGGVAGHAGLFSTVEDIFTLLHRLMFAAPNDPWINSSTVHTFTTVYNTSQSSRALGWDTNNYDASIYRLCGNLSSTTYTHTGYTGTQVCNDPVREIITILLTNRCYPDDSKESKYKIATARRSFNNAVKEVVDHQKSFMGKVTVAQ